MKKLIFALFAALALTVNVAYADVTYERHGDEIWVIDGGIVIEVLED